MSGQRKHPQMRERAIIALMSTGTMTEAAKQLGITRQALDKWMRSKPDFREEYEQRKQEQLDAVLKELRLVSRMAVRTLERNLRCGNPQVEIQAARTLLELAGVSRQQATNITMNESKIVFEVQYTMPEKPRYDVPGVIVVDAETAN